MAGDDECTSRDAPLSVIFFASGLHTIVKIGDTSQGFKYPQHLHSSTSVRTAGQSVRSGGHLIYDDNVIRADETGQNTALHRPLPPWSPSVDRPQLPNPVSGTK